MTYILLSESTCMGVSTGPYLTSMYIISLISIGFKNCILLTSLLATKAPMKLTFYYAANSKPCWLTLLLC